MRISDWSSDVCSSDLRWIVAAGRSMVYPCAQQPRGREPDFIMTATIALVDDDKNILTSVSIALQAEGFITRIYSDGEAALKALIDNPPDLAVFDIKMPRIDRKSTRLNSSH